ncbi:MAG TPA: hypothetical protein VFZ78_11215 [Flavisolibacter sp.]
MKQRSSISAKIFNWELWPFMLRYSLIIPVWFWYCLRARSLWFFSTSNPTITFGGFEGEAKREMYDLLPEGTFPVTVYVNPKDMIEDVHLVIRKAGLQYPFVVKPDIGMKGLLFRKIDNAGELEAYHQKVPVDYIVQELVEYPLEVSVFYFRYPWEKRGVITGFIQKDLMDVYGDGRKTLWQLIQEHPQAQYRQEEMRVKHQEQLHKVIPHGERFILTYAANLNRGARFTNLHDQIDAALLDVFDPISRRAQFFYGRYDIKCASIADLKAGRNFTILEFNGAGAEPNHVYHSGFSLFAAYSVFLMHWKVLYRISIYNHRQGLPFWSFRRGWHFLRVARKHLAVLEKYDASIPV